jgi:L-asparaginase
MTISNRNAGAVELPAIKILATGGTIAGAGKSTVEGQYTSGKIPVDVLIDAIPELGNIAAVSGEQVAQIGSQAMTPDIWLTLARRVNALLTSEDVDGIVITHGTDTLEETAYFLNLTVRSDKPVVLVGAMRPFTAMSADGAVNIYAAVTLAASPKARGQGVLVAMNDNILAARGVTKTNTTNVATFQDPDTGALGTVANGKVSFYRRPVRAHTTVSEFDVDGLEVLPSVDILYGYAGDNSALVDATVEAGARGIVFAGVGNGNLHPGVEAALAKARQIDVAVVRSSRVQSGRVTLDAEIDDAKFGFVVADDLGPQKARVLLMLGLTQTREPQALQELFFKY